MISLKNVLFLFVLLFSAACSGPTIFVIEDEYFSADGKDNEADEVDEVTEIDLVSEEAGEEVNPTQDIETTIVLSSKKDEQIFYSGPAHNIGVVSFSNNTKFISLGLGEELTRQFRHHLALVGLNPVLLTDPTDEGDGIEYRVTGSILSYVEENLANSSPRVSVEVAFTIERVIDKKILVQRKLFSEYPKKGKKKNKKLAAAANEDKPLTVRKRAIGNVAKRITMLLTDELM